jgi:integrase
MASHQILTEARIKTDLAAADDDKEVRLYDAKLPGLLLWRRPRGKSRWYVLKRAGGKMVWVSLGDINHWPTVPLEVARRLAAEALGKLAVGESPTKAKAVRRAEAKGGKVPFQDAIDHVADRMATKGRSERHIAELRRVSEAILAKGVRDLCDPRAGAVAEKWIKSLPCGDLTKHRYAAHLKAIGRAALRKYPDLVRDPFLSVEAGTSALPAPALFELSELVQLASDAAMTTEWGRLFVFLLYTGCRMREGEYARWDRIDLERRTFIVQPPTAAEKAAGEAVKRDKGRTVTLQPELVELLRQWPHPKGGEFVFADECRTTSPLTTESIRAHLKLLGIPVDGRHIHTLRHAHVALSVACGVSDMQLRLSVGHGGPAMTAHYANAAMRWRGMLADWDGTFKLRDKAEVERLTGGASIVAKVAV